MAHQDAKPKFGGRLKTPSYYAEVRAYIGALRDTKTLRNIALMLNSAGYLTPSGKPFTKQAVSNFLRSPAAQLN
jgi:hypothetical protein